MDLSLYLRVLGRHRRVLFVGLALAVMLSVLSYYRVEAAGVGLPSLEPRKDEVWQSQANVFITEGGFPAGNRIRSDSAGRFTGLALIYSRLAQSDEVLRQIEKDRPLPGVLQAIPLVDTTAGNIPLPMVALFGKAASPEAAQVTASRGLDGFLKYVRASQVAADIPTEQRVQLRVVNAPGRAILIDPRKKTLPIVVFLAVLIATIAAAFVLENASLNRASRGSVEVPESGVQEKPEPVITATPERKKAPAPAPEPEPEPELTPVRRWA